MRFPHPKGGVSPPKFLLWTFLIFLGTAPSTALAQQAPGTVRLKVEVNLVRVLATVRDAQGRLLSHLTAEDFEIYDEGQPQRIAVFQRETDLPLRIALLVDCSLSTAKELEFETAAALAFLRRVLRPSDLAAVYCFAARVEKLASFTSDTNRLEQAVQRLTISSGTSLYDAIYMASMEMRNIDSRKAVVVITDGGDTTSQRGYPEALQAALAAEATIFSIAVIPIRSQSGRHTAGEHALVGLSQATGGAFYPQDSTTELGTAFAQIETELRSQYLLGYYPASGIARQPQKVNPTSEPRYVRIEVKMKNQGLVVTARRGYYAYDPF